MGRPPGFTLFPTWTQVHNQLIWYLFKLITDNYLFIGNDAIFRCKCILQFSLDSTQDVQITAISARFPLICVWNIPLITYTYYYSSDSLWTCFRLCPCTSNPHKLYLLIIFFPLIALHWSHCWYNSFHNSWYPWPHAMHTILRPRSLLLTRKGTF